VKFALDNDNKSETTKGMKGYCPSCGAELVAKCGEFNIHHWAHNRSRNCDPWWENETEWHRSWKNNFPKDWQEVIHTDSNSEKHIADVKTQAGWVLEFQHSHLKPEERRSRNAFYAKLVWVVDGTRLKTSKPQFEKALNESTPAYGSPPSVFRIFFPEESRLLRDWQDSNALVFFDFQGREDNLKSMLWFMFPEIISNEAYVSPFSRQNFIEMHNTNKFEEFFSDRILPISKLLADATQAKRKNVVFSHQPTRIRRPFRF